jgi:hypothetical protein
MSKETKRGDAVAPGGARSKLCPSTELGTQKICAEEERERALRAMTGTAGGPRLIPTQVAPT